MLKAVVLEDAVGLLEEPKPLITKNKFALIMRGNSCYYGKEICSNSKIVRDVADEELADFYKQMIKCNVVPYNTYVGKLECGSYLFIYNNGKKFRCQFNKCEGDKVYLLSMEDGDNIITDYSFVPANDFHYTYLDYDNDYSEYYIIKCLSKHILDGKVIKENQFITYSKGLCVGIGKFSRIDKKSNTIYIADKYNSKWGVRGCYDYGIPFHIEYLDSITDFSEFKKGDFLCVERSDDSAVFQFNTLDDNYDIRAYFSYIIDKPDSFSTSSWVGRANMRVRKATK